MLKETSVEPLGALGFKPMTFGLQVQLRNHQATSLWAVMNESEFEDAKRMLPFGMQSGNSNSKHRALRCDAIGVSETF